MELLLRIIYAILSFFLFLFDIFSSLSRFVKRLDKKISVVAKRETAWFLDALWKALSLPFVILSRVFRAASSLRSRFGGFSFRLRRRKKHRAAPTATLWLKLRYFVFGGVFSFAFLFVPLAVGIFLLDLPSPHELSTRHPSQTTKIYDRNNVLLYQMYATQNRTLVLLPDVPKHLRQATLAIEDKNFYKHPGFDVTSIIRALRENITGRSLQGGSTITQQLIKSSLLTPEPSVIRKLKELTLAFWAERLYTKDQILEMYFNQVPYGGTAWGVEAASEVYFDKNVKDLTLAESTFLAGITSAPSTYSPYGVYPNLWRKRQKEVLRRMVLLGFITKKQADEAAKEPLSFKSPQIAIYAPHFVAYVKKLLVDRYGLAMVERGGLQVKTTLDLKVHQMVQKAVTEEVASSSHLNLTNGASIVANPATGEILAMVGSKDYTDKNGGNVNVTTSERQPGSSIKVVTYSAALSRGMTAVSIIADTPTTYAIAGSSPYSPVNYDGRYYGSVSLRFALANSLNIPAVKTLHQVGIPLMISLGKDMGITTWGNPNNYGLSVTLGAAEVTMVDMAAVYGTLANGGIRKDVTPILSVTDYKGNLLEKKDSDSGHRVLREGVAFIVSDILSDERTRSVAFGTNSPLTVPGHKVSVKTGTTDNKRDNWTIGYTNNYVVAVWVGNNDNSPMSPYLTSGITGAAPIWNLVMSTLLVKSPEKRRTAPSDVVQKLCLGRTEYFLKGTENSVSCNITPSPRMQRRSF